MPMSRPRSFSRIASALKSFSQERGRANRRAALSVRNATAPISEVLENRVMLTTITTTGLGDELQFTFASETQLVSTTGTPVPPVGRYVEISQGGATTAEYLGSYLDENGNPQITEIPGVFSNGTISDGGLEGGQGTVLLGQQTIDDPITGDSFPFDPAGNTDVEIKAIGSDPGTLVPADKGIVYGINVLSGTGTNTAVPIIQLIEFPNSATAGASTQANVAGEAGAGEVIADIGQPVYSRLLDDPGPTGTTAGTPGAVGTINAAAFDPINGLFYFVVTGSGPLAIPQLFSVNVHAGNNAAIRQSVAVVPGDFGVVPAQAAVGITPAVPATTVVISAITFDQTGTNTALLDVFDTKTSPVANSETGATTTTYELSNYSLTNTNGQSNIVTVSALSGASVSNITGIAIVNDDPTAVDQYVYATTAGATTTTTSTPGGGPSLLRIDRGSGATVAIASLVNPTATATPILGADIQDLTYDPLVTDPITGLQGALVGTDSTADALVIISTSIRPPSVYLYAIYVTQGDANSFITVASPLDSLVSDSNAPSGAMSPFIGESGQVAVQNNGGTGGIIAVTAPADTGYAYLGMKLDDGTPVTSATVAGTFGVLPTNITTLTAGFTTAAGVDFGRFLFGGTVTGDISFGGSVDTFYAGWLIAGDTQGLPAGQAVTYSVGIVGTPATSNGLYITGDVRNIWVESDAGGGGVGGEGEATLSTTTGAAYNTGFVGVVGGRIGQYHVVGTQNGVIEADDSVVSDVSSDQIKLVDQEGAFQDGYLGGNALLTNNTYVTAQYLGSLPSTDTTTAPIGTNVITLGGTLQETAADLVDYYAVGLMAGQTITVQLLNESPTNGSIDLGVFDPDGRLVATDYANPNTPFQYTPSMPGGYRFAVATAGDTAFAGTGTPTADIAYLLVINNTNDISIGGVHTGTLIGGSAVAANNGDIGAIVSDVSEGQVLSTGTDAYVDNPILVEADTGNARDIVAPTTAVSVDVPVGGVGLLRSSADELYVEPYGYSDPTTLGTPVGTEYQIVDAATELIGDLDAQVDIGTVRAGSMAVNPAPSFTVNPNDFTSIHGRIDLIDCAGDFGTIGGGGPAITTGPSGDVGFINVDGAVYEDPFFGGGADPTVTHDPGVAVTVTDDGGSNITLTPVGAVTANPAYNASSPVAGVSPTLGPQISLLTYGIRGSGGSVIMNVTVIGGGLDVTSSGNAADGVAEITNIDVQGSGADVIAVPTTSFNTSTGTTTTTTTTTSSNSSTGTTASTAVSPDLSTTIAPGGTTAPDTGINRFELDPSATSSLAVTIEGSNTFNVFDIAGGSFNNITNSTNGELVDINATSIGSLTSDGPIGIPTHASAAQIDPLAVISNAYPFDDQHYGIVVSGDIVNISSASAIGNLVVGGSIGLIQPDTGGAKLPGGVFAGIDGPIVAGDQIDEVIIGQGLLPSGTGSFSDAGIYATGIIGLVTNSQPGAEIRGDIVSESEINAIQLSNSSIINSEVYVVTDFSQASLLNTAGVTLTTPLGTIDTTFYYLGAITLTGDGGIIGTDIEAPDIGPVTVSGGFGIFGTTFGIYAHGQQAQVIAAGYGVRGCTFHGGANLVGISATGSGALVSTDLYDPALFLDRSGIEFDPYSGLVFADFNNLDSYFAQFNILGTTTGTSATTPNIAGITDTGVIEDTNGEGTGTLGSLSAVTIRDTTGDPPSENTVLTLLPIESGFQTSFAYANTIGSVIVRTAINGLELTTGRLGTFASPSVQRMGISLTGILNNLVIHGNYGVAGDGSFIQAFGPHGYIQKLTILGNLNGSVSATAGIGSLIVTGNIVGSVTVTGPGKGLALSLLRIGGTLQDGALNVTGSVGSIIISKSLGVAGDTLNISGNANLIEIGASHQAGSDLALAVDVAGTLRKLIVFGQITGSVTTGGNLTSMTVIGDGTAANIISGNITVGGSLLTSTVTNGNIVSSIIAKGAINSFVINRGIFLNGAVLQSTTAGIRSFRILGGLNYGLDGQVLAANGIGDSIDISGSLGDGTHAALVTADTGTTFRIRGSISATGTITVTKTLNLLQVYGSVASGATISAHPLKKVKISGTNDGTLTTT